MEVNRKSFGKENSSIISKPKGKTLIPLNAKKFGTENKPVVSTTNKPTIESTRNKQLEPVNKLPLRSIDNSKKMIPRSIQGNLPSLSNKSAQPPTVKKKEKKKTGFFVSVFFLTTFYNFHSFSRSLDERKVEYQFLNL